MTNDLLLETVRELVARACLTSSVTLADQKLGADPLIHGGSDALRARFLPSIASGEHLIAFALTEPDAGSDGVCVDRAAFWTTRAELLSRASRHPRSIRRAF